MSSRASATPLVVDLRPSRALRALVALAHAGAWAALVPLGWTWAIAGAALLGPAAVAEWRALGTAGRLLWHADGRWTLAGDGAGPAWRLARVTFLGPWVVVLVLRDGRRVHRLALARDGVAAHQWRRLRVRLRLEGDPGTAGA